MLCRLLLASLCALLSACAGFHYDPSDPIARLEHARHQAKHSIPFPLLLLVPHGIVAGYDLRDYIASDAFASFDSTHTGRESLDEIYYTAFEYTHGSTEAAMLAASYGTFEHETLPLSILGLRIDLPLTSESKARFERRRSHLPRFIYNSAEEDQDKPQHFFASAWLKSTLGMDWLVNLMGHLVEEGETLMVIDGANDPRDIHADHDGLTFALDAEGHRAASPSASLTLNPSPSNAVPEQPAETPR